MERSVGGERACEALVELMLLGQVNRGWSERLHTIAEKASTSCEVKSRRVRCKWLGPTGFLARWSDWDIFDQGLGLKTTTLCRVAGIRPCTDDFHVVVEVSVTLSHYCVPITTRLE